MEDRDIQAVIELADIFIDNILFANHGEMSQFLLNSQENPLLPSLKSKLDKEGNMISTLSSDSSLADKYIDMFDQDEDSNLVTDEVSKMEISNKLTFSSKLSLNPPSDDEVSAASTLSNRRPECPEHVPTMNFHHSGVKVVDQINLEIGHRNKAHYPCEEVMNSSSSSSNLPAMTIQSSLSGNTTTLSTASSPSLSLFGPGIISNSTSPIWLEYAQCMLRSVPPSPTNKTSQKLLN